jgi:hypothetical protein
VAVDLFNRGGLAILDRIERIGCDVLSRRPKLSSFDKAKLIARAVWLAKMPHFPGAAASRQQASPAGSLRYDEAT